MKISVIIASYNYAKYIEQAINSIINQSYENWELIIVDDGSSDDSVEIIKSYCEKDSRIKLFQHNNGINRGLTKTLLLGLSHASGEWIAFLESDDFLEPNNFAVKSDIMKKNPSVNLIFNKTKFIWEGEKKKSNEKKFTNIQKKLSKMNFPKNMFYDFYIDNLIFTFSCVMVKTDLIKSANFNTTADAFLDWWLWIHLAYKNDFYYIDEELTNWRLHDTSYICEGEKPQICLVQISAYKDIYQNNMTNLKLLAFIYLSAIKFIFIRGFRFIKKHKAKFNN